MAIHHCKVCYLWCTDLVSLTLFSFIVHFHTEDARLLQLQPLMSFQAATITLRSNCIYQANCHDSHSPDSQQQNGTKRWPTPAPEHSSVPAELPSHPGSPGTFHTGSCPGAGQGTMLAELARPLPAVNRAVLAQQLKLDRTDERFILTPVERAVLASVLSLTNRATVDAKIKMKRVCKAGLPQKLQRQKDEKQDSVFSPEPAKWSQYASIFHQNLYQIKI